jgi:prepilin-type N-terminal cleavage/methylation domain-containing protein
MRNRRRNAHGARPTPRHAEELARRSSKSQRAFTLLEMLVAMTILAIMGTALFTVFNQSTETWQRADARTRQFVAAREALGLMASELRQALIATNATPATAGPGAQFYGFSKDDDPAWRGPGVVSNRCGQVYFVAPTQTRSSDAKQDLSVIGYWVNQQRELMRYCLSDNESGWQNLDPTTQRPTLSSRLGINVVELRFEFWGPSDDEWDSQDRNRQNWNSEPNSPVLEQRNTLPRAVRITLVAWDPTLDPGADPDDSQVRKRLREFTTIVRLDNAE